ncbi:MAG: hypothetical protein U0457_07910 [Candidatus Sericytochromatia bacterium]
MKNIKFLILILTLGFFSCKKEYPKIDESLLNKQLDDYLINKQKEVVNRYLPPLEKKEGTILKYCEDIKDSDFTPKLSNPINLAISNDGETAYVLNSICNRYTFSNNFVKKDCIISKVIKRNFIYKITKDKKVEILKINGEAPLSCHLGEEITIDEENNLYLADSSNNIIYKLEKEKILSKITLPTEIYMTRPNKDIYDYDGPINIKLKNNKIYFLVFSNGYQYNDPFKLLTIIYEFDYNQNKLNKILKKSISAYLKMLDYGKFFSDDNFYFDVYNNYYYMNLNKSILLEKEDDKNKILNDKNINELKEYAKNLNKKEFISHVQLFKPIIDKNGQLYLVYLNRQLLKIDQEKKEIISIIGTRELGYKDGKGEEARFTYISGSSFDKDNNLYVADTGNNAIRKITPDGVVSTFYKEEL